MIWIAVIPLSVISGLATDAPIDRATLRGLGALRVVVDIGVELQQAGITRARLEKEVEHQLEAAGIVVDANAVEFVGLRVTAAHSKNTPYAVSLVLGLYQSVTLKRDPTLKTITETWSGESVLLVPAKLLQNVLINTVDQLVDQFVMAFRRVNPSP
jgi:hypothetical protein